MANPIRLTIDGIEVAVEKGRTILEAAQSVGIRIPTLCHDRRLIPFGACRLCVVEVEGSRTLVASCAFPVGNKMVVRTDTKRVQEARRQGEKADEVGRVRLGRWFGRYWQVDNDTGDCNPPQIE